MTVWALAEFFIEVKNRTELAPFSFNPDDSPTTELPDATERLRSRGQLVEYAKEMGFRQHRTFVPMISIFRDHARFFRFDRAGAIMSEPFNYITDHKPFSTFIFRYAHANRQTRGFDPTATLASPEEHSVFQKLADDATLPEHARAAFRKAATVGWPVHKLSLEMPWSPDDNTPLREGASSSVREFLVGRPHTKSHSMTGRATRTFAAYDNKRKTHVIIKDYWRVDLVGLTEYQIYLKLLNDSAEGQQPRPLVPTLLGGGDVVHGGSKKAQHTLTDELLSLMEPDHGFAGSIHTRLVFKELCRPLESFKDARELVSVVHDALIGKIAHFELSCQSLTA